MEKILGKIYLEATIYSYSILAPHPYLLLLAKLKELAASKALCMGRYVCKPIGS